MRKLRITLPRQMLTIAKMITLVLANMAAPIRQTKRFAVFKREQYKNLHHLPSGKRVFKYPEGPKFSTKPSAQPDTHKALETIFAMKNNVPMEPPNSGPSVRLIMTDCRISLRKCLTVI